MALPRQPRMSVEDYLALDNASTTARYEYLDGELFMLAGGSTAHSKIKFNLSGMLYTHLRNNRCRAFDSDTRLQLSPTHYVYPDLSISCDPRDRITSDTLQIHYPTVVFEVLSTSTEINDKIKKFNYYRECPTIQEYVMIDSRRIKVESYYREEDGWRLRMYGAGDTLHLYSLSLQLPVNDLYEDVRIVEDEPDI